MRYTVDGSWQRYGRTVIAGSPLRVFRLTAAGETVAREIEVGNPVGTSRLVDRLLDTGSIHPVTANEPNRFSLDDVTVVTPHFGGRPAVDGRVIVDDGSSPPIAGATVRLARNAGPAAARNVGRVKVTTPLVAFVDADVDTLDQLGGGSWMTALLGHFDDERVGLAAPRVCGEPGSPLDLGDQPARIRAGTRVSYVPAAALIVRVAAFDAVGGFDETLRHGEDVDLVWRLDEAGWRCRYDPVSVVWHEPRVGMAARLRQHAAYGGSAAPLAVRHPGALAPVRANGWTAACYALAAAGHPVTAAALAIGSASALVRKLPDLPPSIAFGLAARGHLGAARQLASAVRRVWWPIVVVGGIASRRMRWVGLVAALARPSAAPTDVAFGWGVWRGMARMRTIGPIIPAVSAWPARSPRAGRDGRWRVRRRPDRRPLHYRRIP